MLINETLANCFLYGKSLLISRSEVCTSGELAIILTVNKLLKSNVQYRIHIQLATAMCSKVFFDHVRDY